MPSSKSSSLCSPIRFILCGLVTVLFYVAILTYYMHLNFTSFDFHPHIKHGATSTNDDGDTSATHPTLEKPPPTIPRKKKKIDSPQSTTATSTTKATPTPTTAKQHHQKHKLKHNGYTVGDSDHHAHGHPGGTEEEANQDRRRLEKHNYDSYKDKRFSNMWWRVADFGDQNNNKQRQHLPESLLETQEHIDDDVELYSLLPYQRKAIEDCNDPQLNNFACLIASYDRQMQSNRHHQTSLKCRSIYGAGLIERLQKNRHVMCEPSSLTSSSQLTCFNDRIHSDHNIDTAVCGGSNLVVNYNRMLDGDFPWLQFETGALSLSKCKVPPIVRQRHWHFMHCLRDWMDLGFQSSSSSNSQTSSVCEKEQEKEKEQEENEHQQQQEDTFFVTRSGDYSPFALAHDWVNTVIVYAVGNISRSNVQINIMDRMTVGFYSPMWSLAFSPRKPVSWFPDLRRKYNQRNAPNGVCYGKSSSSSLSGGRKQKSNRAWFNIPARLSPLYNNDDCGASPILRFTSDLLVSSVGASAVQSPSNVFVITVIVRRNYQTGHSIERRIPNWKELVDEMRKPSNKNKFLGVDNEEQEEDNTNNKQKLIVHAIDYADFDFDQQLNISRSTDLLVGMHGAGLIQSMFLPSYGGLFEFFCPDRPPSNNRYENLARRLGISYSSYDIQDSQNRVPVQKVIEGIRRLSKKVYHAKKERV